MQGLSRGHAAFARLSVRPVADWRRVLFYAWSIRLMVLAAILTAFDNVLPLVIPYVPPAVQIVLAVLNGFVTLAAIVARLLAQKSLEKGQGNESKNSD